MNDCEKIKFLLGQYADKWMSMSFSKRVSFRNDLNKIRYYNLSVDEKEEKINCYSNIKNKIQMNKEKKRKERKHKEESSFNRKYVIETKSGRFFVSTINLI